MNNLNMKVFLLMQMISISISQETLNKSDQITNEVLNTNFNYINNVISSQIDKQLQSNLMQKNDIYQLLYEPVLQQPIIPSNISIQNQLKKEIFHQQIPHPSLPFDIAHIKFAGIWQIPYQDQITQGFSQFNYFTKKTGSLELYFESSVDFGRITEQQWVMNQFPLLSVQITLYDGEYHDQKAVSLQQFYIGNIMSQSESVNGVQIAYRGDVSNIQIVGYDRFTKQFATDQSQNVSLVIIIKNKNPVSIQQIKSADDIQIFVQMYTQKYVASGESRYFMLQSSLLKDNINSDTSVVLYSLLASLVGIWKMISAIKISDFIEEDEQYSNQSKQLSMISVTLAIYWDVFWCMLNMYFALSFHMNQINYYFLPATIYFLLSTIIEMRLLVILWKQRYFQQFTDMIQVRNSILTFYAMFYLGMMIFLLALYSWVLYNWFAILMSLILIPQIVQTVIRGQRPTFQPAFILGYYVSRLIMPYYFRIYKNQLFYLTPSYRDFSIFVLLTAIQVGIVMMQSKYGSRFFIPSICLPRKYNYFKCISYSVAWDDNGDIERQLIDHEQNDTCVICLFDMQQDPDDDSLKLDYFLNNTQNQTESLKQPLLTQEDHQDQQKKQSKKQTKQLSKTIMLTPCNHKFHIQCLNTWMQLKLECPTCRKPLPPID